MRKKYSLIVGILNKRRMFFMIENILTLIFAAFCFANPLALFMNDGKAFFFPSMNSQKSFYGRE